MIELINKRIKNYILLIVISLSINSCSTTSFKKEALTPLIESRYIYIKWADNLPAKPYREKLYNVTKSAFVNAGFEVVNEFKNADLIVVLSGKYDFIEQELKTHHGINQTVLVKTGIRVFILAVYKEPDNPNYYIIFGKHAIGSSPKSVMVNTTNGFITESSKGNVVTDEMYLQASEQAFIKYQKQLNDILDMTKK